MFHACQVLHTHVLSHFVCFAKPNELEIEVLVGVGMLDQHFFVTGWLISKSPQGLSSRLLSLKSSLGIAIFLWKGVTMVSYLVFG